MPVIDWPRLRVGIEDEFWGLRRDPLPPRALDGEDVGELKVELLKGCVGAGPNTGLVVAVVCATVLSLRGVLVKCDGICSVQTVLTDFVSTIRKLSDSVSTDRER